MSCDEVGLVDHATRLPTTDADEDALVEPVELGDCCLDLSRSPKHVFACFHVLAAPEPCQDLGAAVADTSRLDIEEIATVGLERGADVSEQSRRAGLSANRRLRLVAVVP